MQGRRRFLTRSVGALTALQIAGQSNSTPGESRCPGLPVSAQPLQRQTLSEPAQAFISKHRASLSTRDFQLLSRSVETLEANILTPTDDNPGPLPWHPKRGICPSPFRYRGVWTWDGSFHAIGAVRFDPVLAREQLSILLNAQLPSGALCDVIFEDGSKVTDFGKPPVLPWAAEVVDRSAPDDAFLQMVYTKSVKYEAHWCNNRRGAAEDLFHFDSGNPDPARRAAEARMEAGWDNSVRWDEASNDWWAIDLNCNMVSLYRSLAYMAGRLGNQREEHQWVGRADALGAVINRLLYDEGTGLYLDRHRHTGSFSRAVTPASFLPLYVRIASPEQAKRLAAVARDPGKFYPTVPSVAFDDPAFNPLDYWRGPSWLNIAYFMLKGLQYYGYHDTADRCREWLLNTCSGYSLWEYYASRGHRAGTGLGAPQYGWTAVFVMEFLLNWDPDSPH
jgi:putative isomerase